MLSRTTLPCITAVASVTPAYAKQLTDTRDENGRSGLLWPWVTEMNTMALPPDGALKACPRCPGILIFKSHRPRPAKGADTDNAPPRPTAESTPLWLCESCGYYEAV